MGVPRGGEEGWLVARLWLGGGVGYMQEKRSGLGGGGQGVFEPRYELL